MTRPLPDSLGELLSMAEHSLAWEAMDKERLRMQVLGLRDAYPMSDVRLAQFLGEIAKGLQQVLDGDEDKVRDSLEGYQTGLLLLAAAVSREKRGRPPV